MKTRMITATCMSIALAISCKKIDSGYTNDINDINVNARAITVNVNDSVRFDIAGNPDNISFFSGETGAVYAYRNRTVLTGGTLKMKFETRVINKAADTLDVLLSNDFTGVYDSANVAQAKWKLLNNKFLFPAATTPLGTFVPSGATPGDFFNINDSVNTDKPFYVAFRYNVTKGSNIEWSVNKLGVYNTFSNGIATATVIDTANNNSGAFVPVSMLEPTRWSKTSVYYKCLNSTTAKIGASHYYISRALNPNAVAPDAPIVIKNISQSALSYFAYKFAAPGTYKVTFVASNARLNIDESVVKELTITVQ